MVTGILGGGQHPKVYPELSLMTIPIPISSFNWPNWNETKPKIDQFDEHICHMGSNHQLGSYTSISPWHAVSRFKAGQWKFQEVYPPKCCLFHLEPWFKQKLNPGWTKNFAPHIQTKKAWINQFNCWVFAKAFDTPETGLAKGAVLWQWPKGQQDIEDLYL